MNIPKHVIDQKSMQKMKFFNVKQTFKDKTIMSFRTFKNKKIYIKKVNAFH